LAVIGVSAMLVMIRDLHQATSTGFGKNLNEALVMRPFI